MVQRKYTFYYLSKKYSNRILASLCSLSIVGLAAALMELNDLDKLLWPVSIVLVVMWAFLVGYFIVKQGKKYPEEITFTQKGFRSLVFGHIPYEDIISYHIDLFPLGFSGMSPDMTGFYLHIKLQDKRKLQFALNMKYYEESIDAYMAFTERFLNEMAVFGQMQREKNVHPNASEGTRSHLRDCHQSAVVNFATAWKIMYKNEYPK